MSTNYRNRLGNHITFGQWKDLLTDVDNNGSKETVIIKGEYEVTVSKRFTGTSGCLFKLSVECSEDLEDFYGYNVSFQGDIKAEIDYDRILIAINNDVPLMDDGIVVILED